MPLKPGIKLGTYEIEALIGAGGMGEVYKARDPKLDRLVAIKVLPAAMAADAGLVSRFEREAKAVAALSHPNILGIFEFGTQEGISYAVMELLEGESLRDKLKGGALAPKRAVEIATELAEGLGAAHAQGIIHRDVKPENIFLTKEGRVKILDFGLAKQSVPREAVADMATEAMSALAGTAAGMILGTVGYMSPEQVKGEPADQRADVFAFGVVLYEMLSGQRPFQGGTPHHTMTAILDQDQPELISSRGALPQGLERLVSHCLEKRPEARFQSMKDVAYDLQNLSTVTTGAHGPVAAPARRWGWSHRVAAVLPLVLLAGVFLWLTGNLHLGQPTHLTFIKVTYKPGTIETACFGPDGKTIFFSERIHGGQPEIFVLHPGAREPVPLGIKDAVLQGVTGSGELVLLREPRFFRKAVYRGTLAQAGPGGGAVKEIRENVEMAAWTPNGFATVVDSGGNRVTLAFAGHTILEGPSPGLVFGFLRVSREGTAVAFACAQEVEMVIRVVGLDGKPRILTRPEGEILSGLAWGPDGGVWYSEIRAGQTTVWALSLGGSRRLLWRGQGHQALLDVAPDGRLLLVDQQERRGVLVRRAESATDEDISIASGTQAVGFSDDGRRLLLMEAPVLDGETAEDQTYLWTADGSLTAHIGPGTPFSLSPDGKWIQAVFYTSDPKALDPEVATAIREVGLDLKAVLDPVHRAPCLVFLPTGPSRPWAKAIPGNLGNVEWAFLAPDNQKILFNGSERGVPSWWVLDRTGSVPRRLSPPGFETLLAGLAPISPDGTQVILYGDDSFLIQPMAGGEPRPGKGLAREERILAWSRDQKSLICQTSLPPVQFFRLDPATGKRTPLFTYQPSDASGLVRIRSACTTPDAKIFALNYVRQLSNLYLVEGLK